ncbi:MAG: dynamin family protein [Spirochaetaceae bacterium]|nr:dynamin family protein [Spirochaetaceae bacterium]
MIGSCYWCFQFRKELFIKFTAWYGGGVLPTGIAPETALAAELRYDIAERIEAVKNDDSIESYTLDEFKEIGKKAADIKYLKVYLSNSNLKDIEPLVLVDMPGFESPIEAHDKSINVYLNRGAYFVVLVSAQEGTLHRSAIRKLQNVLDCDRDFSIIVSKANLVTEDNASIVCNKIASQIDIEFSLDKTPVPVGKDGADALKKIIESINPNLLFKAIVNTPMKNELYTLESSVNVKISTLKRNEGENIDAIDQLKRALVKLERTRDHMITNATSTGAIKEKTDVVISNIGRALSNNVDHIISVSQKGGADKASEEISDIIKESLLSEMKDITESMASDITGKINIEIHDIERTFNTYAGSSTNSTDVSLDQFSTLFTNTINNGMASLNSMVENRKNKEDSTKSYKAITSLLAISTNIINPIAELAIVFLPEIINFFSQNMMRRQEEEARRRAQEQAEQAREHLRSQLLTELIPNVKRELRPKVEKMISERAGDMVTEITEQYRTLLEQKQQEINAAEAERKQHQDELNEKIANLEAVLSTVKEARAKVC